MPVRESMHAHSGVYAERSPMLESSTALDDDAEEYVLNKHKYRPLKKMCGPTNAFGCRPLSCQ